MVKNVLKMTIKVACGACAAAAILTASSIIASKVVTEEMCKGIKSAKNGMKRILLRDTNIDENSSKMKIINASTDITEQAEI